MDDRTRILIFGYMQTFWWMSMVIYENNMNLFWSFTREAILQEDLNLENLKVFFEHYFHERLICRTRSVWMRYKYTGWWEEIVSNFTIDDWIQNFRMSKNTFKYICQQLETSLAPKFNPLMPREPLSVQKQVAITIFTYASCCEYRVVGNLFGVHKATVWKCIHQVTSAINDILMPIWIKLPDEEECLEIAKEFKRITGMPNFIGVIDGSHIPIVPPSIGYRDFINRKGWPSYVLQGLVDHRLRFRNINIESPGSNHDANVFRNSTLYTHYEQLICQEKKVISGVRIPFLIMGDPAYPLLTWLMKGFTRSDNRTPNQESFNAYMNAGRVKVEIAFGRLKSRWRRISKRADCHQSFVPALVSACCILHNILETKNEYYQRQWDKARTDDELLFPQPESNDENGEDTDDANRVRNVLLDIVSTLPRRRCLI